MAQEQRHISTKTGCLFILVFWLLVFIVGGLFLKTDSETPSPQIDSSNTETVIEEFIKRNQEYGNLKFPWIEDLDDWQKGPRAHVTTDKGKFIFYLENGDVVTVYNSDPRVELYRKK